MRKSTVIPKQVQKSHQTKQQQEVTTTSNHKLQEENLMFRIIALSYSRSPISIKNCAVCKEKVWLIDTQKKKKSN